ncbi:MAG: 2OG-Fe(II) oxygenase [Casimicrobium sp.]
MRSLRSFFFATAESAAAPALLDYERLLAIAGERATGYAKNSPYPHTAIDDVLARAPSISLSKELPQPGASGKWDRYFAEGFENKWAISDDASLPLLTRQLVLEMNSSRFLTFLERLTGIEHLLPDPHLEGAGLHFVPNGGVLQIHADFNYSKRLNAYRRVNVFIYLNPRWNEGWGGALELWDGPHGSPVAVYPPQFNRMVVFSSSSETFHGHPHPITCPAHEWRTSLAMYYYTSAPPTDARTDSHNTIYKGLHI